MYKFRCKVQGAALSHMKGYDLCTSSGKRFYVRFSVKWKAVCYVLETSVGPISLDSPVLRDWQVTGWCNCLRLMMSHGCPLMWWCRGSTQSPPVLPPPPPCPPPGPLSCPSTENPEQPNWTGPPTPDPVCGHVYCERGEEATSCLLSRRQWNVSLA